MPRLSGKGRKRRWQERVRCRMSWLSRLFSIHFFKIGSCFVKRNGRHDFLSRVKLCENTTENSKRHFIFLFENKQNRESFHFAIRIAELAPSYCHNKHVYVTMPFLCCCRPTTLPSEVYSEGAMIWNEEAISGSLILRNFKSPRKTIVVPLFDGVGCHGRNVDEMALLYRTESSFCDKYRMD